MGAVDVLICSEKCATVSKSFQPMQNMDLFNMENRLYIPECRNGRPSLVKLKNKKTVFAGILVYIFGNNVSEILKLLLTCGGHYT